MLPILSKRRWEEECAASNSGELQLGSLRHFPLRAIIPAGVCSVQHRGALLILDIVTLNRFVQCNVHMEDMRIAQRVWPSAVPPAHGAGSNAVIRLFGATPDAASRFCQYPSP